MHPVTRRQAIRDTAAWAALLLSQNLRHGFALEPSERELIPFLDLQPAGRPMLRWQDLSSWITPTAQLFSVNHYGPPKFDPAAWRLEVSGLVRQPRSFTFEEIQRRPAKEIIATLECSGNSSNPGFMGAIGNVRWTGTPLAPLLEQCAPLKRAREVVFYGSDAKTEKIRGNDYEQNFARSLGWADAFRDHVLLAYQFNGQPLPPEHGGPVRLIVPGWFGIAWVKWLSRIELLDRRFMSRFMARDYVTIRGEEKNGRTIWRETSVGPIDVKSMTARALRRTDGSIRFSGAAWTDGTPLRAVEVQIDRRPWAPAQLEPKPVAAPYAWTFWHFVSPRLLPGDHTVVSRAMDEEGRVQPAPDAPEIRLKKTYWEANQQHPRHFRIE